MTEHLVFWYGSLFRRRPSATASGGSRLCGRIVSFAVFSLLLATPLLFGPAQAEELQSTLNMDHFFIGTLPDALRVESGLSLKDADPVKAQLRDGAQMILSYKIRLERLRPVLSNVTVSEAEVLFHVRHDPLLREFLIFSDGEPPLRQKNFDSLLASAWHSLSIALPLSEALQTGESYRIAATVTLQYAKVPPWLEQALFFWSWDVVPPLSFTQTFTF